MLSEDEIQEKLQEACRAAAEPERARRNIERLLASGYSVNELLPVLRGAALLFSSSQFLANFCVSEPSALASGMAALKRPLTWEEALEGMAILSGETDTPRFMKGLRLYKKRALVGITLRFLLGETDILAIMEELTILAEAVLHAALHYSLETNTKRHGQPAGGGRIALIALGKLGGRELNYSSDVDLMAVYGGSGSGQTPGAEGPAGVVGGRISEHEYYCKVVELFNRILSSATEDGVAYRVDMRLRPQGRKGDLAMPLGAFRVYLSSWGRTWERMAYIRARPVAGDLDLGAEFMAIAEEFVWQRTVDYPEIEEIRALKKKIDSTLLKDDIKRGWGGIREAEFFVHTFQLIYGRENRALRTYRLLNAQQGLRRLGLIPEEELSALVESYLFLRRVEHFLQMKDDLQTYLLPADAEGLLALARNMGYGVAGEFLSDLRLMRMRVKSMYNSLLGTKEDIHAEALSLLEGDLRDEELKGFLSFRRVRDADAGLDNLRKIREQVGSPKTPDERALIRRVLPGLLESALRTESPDRALAGLERFFSSSGIRRAHLTAFAEEKALARGMIKMFSLSTLLTRLFLGDPIYLNLLVEEMPIRKSMRRMEAELARALAADGPLELGLVEYRSVEWLRLGMFFLSGVIAAHDLGRRLSHLAEAALRAAARHAEADAGFAVVALGKLGGREITYGSDLDLLFISQDAQGIKQAERILKTLAAYTVRGQLYRVDMRLRPDGSKGPLVKDLEGYRRYYEHQARPWEVQALLKARAVGGDPSLCARFAALARNVILKRAAEIKKEDINAMREKIMEERSREPEGIDIKLGPGGMEDIEFFVQWLQLSHAGRAPRVLVQDTLAAISRLMKGRVLERRAGAALTEGYLYLSRLNSFLRLNEETVLREETETAALAAKFMGNATGGEFFERINGLKKSVMKAMET